VGGISSAAGAPPAWLPPAKAAAPRAEAAAAGIVTAEAEEKVEEEEEVDEDATDLVDEAASTGEGLAADKEEAEWGEGTTSVNCVAPLLVAAPLDRGLPAAAEACSCCGFAVSAARAATEAAAGDVDGAGDTTALTAAVICAPAAAVAAGDSAPAATSCARAPTLGEDILSLCRSLVPRFH